MIETKIYSQGFATYRFSKKQQELLKEVINNQGLLEGKNWRFFNDLLWALNDSLEKINAKPPHPKCYKCGQAIKN